MVPCLPDIALSGKYDPTTAARKLGVSTKTIYRAMRAGLLRFHASENKCKRYIKGNDLIRYFNTN